MYTKLLAVALLFGMPHAKSQSDSIYGEILITHFRFDDKSIKLDSPKQIILEKTGCSDIVSLVEIDGLEIGVRFELITSYIGFTPTIIEAHAFFVKKDGKWEINSLTMHENIFLAKKTRGKFLMRPEDFSQGSHTVGTLSGEHSYAISRKARYYLLQ